ncbi:Uncharacterised protein [Neisseria animaloris]|uniref:Uncharacterized protein n=2 Tax=Neisseria animaloris TaxID=326522 RepID=A0A3S5BPM6_9NEIS|nr:Uncharacterised protein [Neisseria animaloris]
MSEIFSLLKELITYIFSVYQQAGIEALVNSTHPSIDDLLRLLDQVQNNIEPTQLNAIQAVILTKLLLTDIKANSEDCQSYSDQFEQLIKSLSTIDQRENLI